jgi:hypothetical protein
MVKKYIENEVENKNEESGITPLIGKNITVFCCRFFYYGQLIEEGENYIKLRNPHIVYRTGNHAEDTFERVESMEVETWNIMKQSIESFGVLKSKPKTELK